MPSGTFPQDFPYPCRLEKGGKLFPSLGVTLHGIFFYDVFP